MLHPLKGVVVDNGAELTIRLSTRAIIRINSHPTLRLGDTCYVLFNYESMRIRQILTEEEWLSMDELPVEDIDETEDKDNTNLALSSLGLSCCFS